jgi:hypothetical protein
MEMNIDLYCQSCVGRVFRAIGDYIAKDEETAQIVAVNFLEDDEVDDCYEAEVSWDLPPSPSQVSLFREVWDEESGFSEAVILHNSHTSILSRPVDRKHEMN